jgi:Raf kinase inhibitor-like YbhB/YbcL family protein
MKLRVMLALCLGILLLAACSTPAAEPTEAPPVEEVPVEPTKAPEPTAAPADTEAPPVPTEAPMPFELTSVIIAHEQPIPAHYSCDGEDLSPPLDWNDPPASTQSFALIMDDPDAPGGTWVHWVVYNIPAEERNLLAKIPSEAQLSNGTIQGVNSWGKVGYGGPCPPSGTHRYFFKLYALDTTLSLDENAGKDEVVAAMEGHILAEAELMGTFSR